METNTTCSACWEIRWMGRATAVFKKLFLLMAANPAFLQDTLKLKMMNRQNHWFLKIGVHHIIPVIGPF